MPAAAWTDSAAPNTHQSPANEIYHPTWIDDERPALTAKLHTPIRAALKPIPVTDGEMTTD